MNSYVAVGGQCSQQRRQPTRDALCSRLSVDDEQTPALPASRTPAEIVLRQHCGAARLIALNRRITISDLANYAWGSQVLRITRPLMDTSLSSKTFWLILLLSHHRNLARA